MSLPPQYTFRVKGKGWEHKMWVESVLSQSPGRGGRPRLISWLTSPGAKRGRKPLYRPGGIPRNSLTPLRSSSSCLMNRGVFSIQMKRSPAGLGSPEGLPWTIRLIVHPPERRDEAMCTVQGMLAGTMDFCPGPADGQRWHPDPGGDPGYRG